MKSKQGNKTHWTEFSTFIPPANSKHNRPWIIPVKNCHRTIYMKIGPGNSTTQQPLFSLYRKGGQRSDPKVSPISKMIGRTLPRCDEAHFWLNGYVNKQNCRIWSEANPQVYVETPLQPEKLTVWCALWAGGILLQKR
ncbi:hypothetical protein TNCV_4248731 [Trichonephila clavipes]|nr:hypothetical protein TNCV_4248731 [Trichonephila clavipes]